jgi:hypothetical protein
MQQPAPASIDFDEWAALAAADPAAFEARRAEVIDEFIRQAPACRQQRLRRLQWRIDQARRLSPTPLSACMKLSQMMWDSFAGDGGLNDALNSLHRGEHPPHRSQAAVLPFRARTLN